MVGWQFGPVGCSPKTALALAVQKFLHPLLDAGPDAVGMLKLENNPWV